MDNVRKITKSQSIETRERISDPKILGTGTVPYSIVKQCVPECGGSDQFTIFLLVSLSPAKNIKMFL